jgi:hypothetical protein
VDWTERWLLAYAFTQLVEMGVYAQAHPRVALDGVPPRPPGERLAIAFAASGITHPLVWFAIPALAELWFGVRDWNGVVALAEAFAVLTEAALLAAFGVRWALLWAGTSFLCGWFCYLVFPAW